MSLRYILSFSIVFFCFCFFCQRFFPGPSFFFFFNNAEVYRILYLDRIGVWVVSGEDLSFFFLYKQSMKVSLQVLKKKIIITIANTDSKLNIENLHFLLLAWHIVHELINTFMTQQRILGRIKNTTHSVRCFGAEDIQIESNAADA